MTMTGETGRDSIFKLTNPVTLKSLTDEVSFGHLREIKIKIKKVHNSHMT